MYLVRNRRHAVQSQSSHPRVTPVNYSKLAAGNYKNEVKTLHTELELSGKQKRKPQVRRKPSCEILKVNSGHSRISRLHLRDNDDTEVFPAIVLCTWLSKSYPGL